MTAPRGAVRPGRLLARSGIVIAILAAAAAIVVEGSVRRADRVETPSSLLNDRHFWGSQVRLAGAVSAGSLKPRADGVSFAIRDERGSGRVIVEYQGEIPNQLRGGRVVRVTGRFDGQEFAAQPSTLVVICGRTEPQRHC